MPYAFSPASAQTGLAEDSIPAPHDPADPDPDPLTYRFDGRCRLCQLVPPPFTRAVAYGSYEGTLRDLIHLLKFRRVRRAAKLLGRLLAQTLTELTPSLPDETIVVVPVPLHRSKRRERGFNQAELIARAALRRLSRSKSTRYQFELHPDVLVRWRDTGSQIGLSSHQRRQNLRGAFALENSTSIAGRYILLVDDVYTTGATASECARVLARSGAAGIWVATVGRTLRISAAPVLPAGSFSENLLNEDPFGENLVGRDFPAKDFPSKDFAGKDFLNNDFAGKDFLSKDFTGSVRSSIRTQS